MNKFAMSLSALALTATGTAGLSQEASVAAVVAKKSQTIVDADGRVLGKVAEINTPGGFVTFTAQMKVYRVPLATLSAEGSRLKTTLTRKALGL